MFDKQKLVRVAKIENDNFSIDYIGKIGGRGAYLCKSLDCLLKSKKRKGFEHSFKSKFVYKIYEELENEFKEIL